MQSLSEKEFKDKNLLEKGVQSAAKGVNFWNELLTAGALIFIATLTVAGIGLMLYAGIVSFPLVIVWTIGAPLGLSLAFSGLKNLYQEGGHGKSLFFFSAGFMGLGALLGSIIGTFLFPGLGTISGMAIGVAVGAIIAPLVVGVTCLYRYITSKKTNDEEPDHVELTKQMVELGSELEQDQHQSSNDMELGNHFSCMFNTKDVSPISLDDETNFSNNEEGSGCTLS